MCSRVENAISDDFFNSKKAAKRGRKPNSSGPSGFCRICAQVLLTLKASEGVERRGTRDHQLQWARHNCLAKNLHSMTCYGILRPKSPPLSSENLSLYFASLINRSTLSFVDTTMVSFAHLYFFCHCLELINQTFLKASRPNCNNVFRLKKMKSHYLFIFERILKKLILF